MYLNHQSKNQREHQQNRIKSTKKKTHIVVEAFGIPQTLLAVIEMSFSLKEDGLELR